MTKEEKLKEYFRCAEDPVYFIEKYLKVLVKIGNESFYKPFLLMPHQNKIIKNLATGQNNIISKYRQAGITTLTDAFCAWRICFTPNFKIALIADKLETAINELLVKTSDFIEQVPSFLAPKTLKEKNSQKHKKYDNGCELKAYASNSFRGGSPNLIFLDEAAFFEDGDDFLTSAAPALSAGGSMIINSTPKGQDKLYYPIYEEARNKRNNYILNEIYWYEDPRYNEDLEWVKDDEILKDVPINEYANLKKNGYKPTSTWYRRMCIELKNDPKKIAQELENDFNASAGLFIQEKIIKEHEIRYMCEPQRTEWKQETWIFEDPQPNQRYILGCDVSQNVSSGDFSTIAILKITPNGYEIALEYQGKISPDELGVLVFDYAKRYNAYIVVDNTGGQGYTTIVKLKEMNYDISSIYHHKQTSRGLKENMKDIVMVNNGEELMPGIMITSSNRNFILNEFEKVIRDENMPLRSSRLVSELRTFVVKENGKIEHRKGSHDDLIFAYAIAIYVSSLEFNNIQMTPEQTLVIFETFDYINEMYKSKIKKPKSEFDWVFDGLI